MSGPATTHIIELFVPTASNEGRPFTRDLFDRVQGELLEKFGGVTLFSRSPAEGLWAEGEREGLSRDQMITVEVMSEKVDPRWWAAYRGELEARFLQEEILIRCYQIRKL
jgi:hypothetical protein